MLRCAGSRARRGSGRRGSAGHERRRPGRARPLLQPQPHDNLHLYNSLTRRIERLQPLQERTVSLYVCGITPYDVGHLGHALTYVTFDTLRRWLEFQAYEVRHIQNITDVDDDMVRKSRELGVTIPELTARNHRLYLEEMDALNVQRPDRFPLVSGTMPSIIAMVERLVAGGYAYIVEGHVFFDVSRAPAFGRLSGRTREEQRTGPRTDTMPDEPDHLKRDTLDFLLWQPSTDAGASWPSPWGPGRPGWHIECSTMAQENLGPQIDIHGGGRDLRYPHHDCEIVQSEAASGLAPYVGIWMHNGTMTLDGVKMSKSLGNLVKVSELLARGFTPDGTRLFLLGTHYRADRDFTERELRDWEAKAERLRAAAEGPGGPPDRLRVQHQRVEFMNAMDDDLDTPRAVSVLLSITDDLAAGRIAGETGVPTLVELAGVLGLTLGREQ
ncbi:MAG: cysteine--tRNA ligase [Chloroflexi bacterium]|nr:cysteine--tRNA ligase [Chloroflexota bacterium]